MVLFFIASGSILYFSNVSAISDAKADYEMLIKMGYTDKQIKKIIRKQTFTFYTIPFVLGLLDCVFGHGSIQNSPHAKFAWQCACSISAGHSCHSINGDYLPRLLFSHGLYLQ